MTTLATPFLDTLLADGVITARHHDAARARLAHATSEPFDSLGSALFWLAGENIVTDEEMEKMEEVSLRDAAFASNATRLQALDEYDDCLFEQFDREEAERIRATPWHQRHRPWLIASGVAVLAAGLVWFLQPSRVPPACDDPAVVKTLRSALHNAESRTLQANPMLRMDSRPNYLLTEFASIQELGHLKQERVRGCLATASIDGHEQPFAFEILQGKSGNGFRIEGGNARLLQARYRQVDAAGQRQTLGLPVGEAALAQALRQAVKDRQQRQASGGVRARDVPAGQDRIRDVVALDDCKESAHEELTCTLMAQYQDPMLARGGNGGWVLLESEFTFERNEGDLRAARAFDHQFLNAVLRARLAEAGVDAIGIDRAGQVTPAP